MRAGTQARQQTLHEDKDRGHGGGGQAIDSTRLKFIDAQQQQRGIGGWAGENLTNFTIYI